jgi:hypothetical protein
MSQRDAKTFPAGEKFSSWWSLMRQMRRDIAWCSSRFRSSTKSRKNVYEDKCVSQWTLKKDLIYLLFSTRKLSKQSLLFTMRRDRPMEFSTFSQKWKMDFSSESHFLSSCRAEVFFHNETINEALDEKWKSRIENIENHFHVSNFFRLNHQVFPPVEKFRNRRREKKVSKRPETRSA